MKRMFIAFSIIFLCSQTFSQTQLSENTLTLSENKTSPKADLGNINWLEGHWQGEAFGGIVEEIWSSELGGSMMGSFRLVVNDKVKFYELITIVEENESLVLRLKHFHADLKGWEEKDETVDFPLVNATNDAMYFDGFTIEHVSKNEINMYVMVGDKDNIQEVKFNYHRVN